MVDSDTGPISYHLFIYRQENEKLFVDLEPEDEEDVGMAVSLYVTCSPVHSKVTKHTTGIFLVHRVTR